MEVCEFEGCEKPKRTKGLCSGHYGQKRRGGPLKPLRVPVAGQPCPFDGCGLPIRQHGLCTGHSQQFKKGKELTPLIIRRKIGEAEEEIRKNIRTCSQNTGCGRELPLDQFNSGKDGYASVCKDCKRSKKLESAYGLTLEAWNSLFESQRNCCAICKSPDTGGKGWATDHDHACCPGKKTCGNCVRSILCYHCNTTVGFIETHTDIEAALDYVARNKHLQLVVSDKSSEGDCRLSA
jgi:hypothetical protein